MGILEIIQEEFIEHTPLLSMINEEVLKYMKQYDHGDSMRYIFEASGIRYTVNIWHDDRHHEIGVYEVEFAVDEQKNSGHRTGKDLKNLNSVLQTVTDIVENEVKQKGIKHIKMEGATGEQDIESGFFGTPLRAKLYLRYLRNRYPDDAIKDAGRYIWLDMTKVFPDEYKESSKADQIIKLLVKLSDANEDEAGIRRGLSGQDEDTDFSVDTDFIESNRLGGIYMIINVSEQMNIFDIEWELLDSGESGDANFKDFKELKDWLKLFVDKSTEEKGVENLQG